jgi:outer membrane protein OmpA-like peptidoglycan-associated protein
MTLSKKRANAVVQVLTKKHKIKKDRLLAAGVGFLAPVAANETDEGRGLNRRVEVVRLP